MNQECFSSSRTQQATSNIKAIFTIQKPNDNPIREIFTCPAFLAVVGAALPPHPAAPVLYTCRAGFFPVPLITGEFGQNSRRAPSIQFPQQSNTRVVDSKPQRITISTSFGIFGETGINLLQKGHYWLRFVSSAERFAYHSSV